METENIGIQSHTVPAFDQQTPSSTASTTLRASNESQLLHELLAHVLKDRIISGEWPAGSRIMSEHALQERYGVSRGTVRRALAQLVQEGLLVQRKGKGTFVTRSGVAHPAGARPLSFARALKEQGYDFVTRVLTKEVLPAPAEVTKTLGLAQRTPALFMRRVRYVQDRPVVCQESWENLNACPDLSTHDFEHESLFDAVERSSGHTIAASQIKSTAQKAGREHAGYLGIAPDEPVLVLEQVISLDNHVPIEWSLTWLCGGQGVFGVASQQEISPVKVPHAAMPQPAAEEGLSKEKERELRLAALDIRQAVVNTAHRYRDLAFHFGGALSAAEIFAALFLDVMHTGHDGTPWEQRDRFVLSKAHAAIGLYPVLLKAGFISQKDIDRGLFGKDAVLFKHPQRDPSRGLETSGGSLGMGLGYAAGLALALRKKQPKVRIFCLVGDGECNEGSIWEAASFAGHYKLSNLVCIVDANGMQLDGTTAKVSDSGPLAAKFAACGFEALDVDGQSVQELHRALTHPHTLPLALIAHTTKGEGLSFSENKVEWHDHKLDEGLFEQACAEIERQREAIEHA